MTSAFEEGTPDRAICLVGEAPARYELQANRPFVGPAGQVLDSCLHAAGIARGECYITNLFTVTVRKDEKTGDIYAGAEKLYSPRGGLTEGGQRHQRNLLDRLQNFRGNVVVPLGGPALSAICGKPSITKWRGSPLHSPHFDPPLKCIPTIHPAATLRGAYLWRYYIISDLRKVRRHSAFPELRLPNRTFLLEPTFTEVKEFVREMQRAKRVAADIEVYNHQVSCLSLCADPSLVMSIPLIDQKGSHYFTDREEVDIWEDVAHVLGDEEGELVGQNLMFDTWFLLDRNHIFTRRRILDLMIAHSLLYPEFEKNLGFFCSLYTDQPYYKDDKKLWDRITEDPYTFWRYNALDSAVTLECWNAIEGELADGNQEAYEQTIALFPILTYFQLRGMKVDHDALAVTKQRIDAELSSLYSRLEEAAAYPFNPLSPKQCIEYFYGHRRIKPYISRKTGAPTCDDKALQRIIKRYQMPEARLTQEIRGLEKLKGTYLETVLDRDGRLRASYNIRGNKFGRLSSSETVFGTGTNMQNLHPEFKEFLVTDDV